MSQTIYGEGDIQVVEVGAIDVNKIQQFWHIQFKFFSPFLFASTFFYSTFGKNSHTKINILV
jgi:ABC-type sugar transport system permease subunit